MITLNGLLDDFDSGIELSESSEGECLAVERSILEYCIGGLEDRVVVGLVPQPQEIVVCSPYTQRRDIERVEHEDGSKSERCDNEADDEQADGETILLSGWLCSLGVDHGRRRRLDRRRVRKSILRRRALRPGRTDL